MMITGAIRRRGGPPYPMPTAAPYNVPVYCDVPTYDNTGSSLHFSVIDMHNEIGRDWRGWRFWACMTPYYRQDARLENPSIIVSNDGFHWVLPNGLTNPIYPPPRNPAHWNCDSDIAYDPTSDELVMVVNAADVGGSWSAAARSRDGVSWPARPSPSGYWVGSPSLFQDADGSWLIYGVYTGGGGSSGTRVMRRYRDPHSTGRFDAPFEVCTGFSGLHEDGLWHSEVLIDRSGVYRALIWAGWTSGWVYAASSTNGINWSRSAQPVLKPAGAEPTMSGESRWDSAETYRGSFTEGLPGEDFWRVWYAGTPGGTTTGTSWRIGYTQIPKSGWPAPPA